MWRRSQLSASRRRAERTRGQTAEFSNVRRSEHLPDFLLPTLRAFRISAPLRRGSYHVGKTSSRDGSTSANDPSPDVARSSALQRVARTAGALHHRARQCRKCSFSRLAIVSENPHGFNRVRDWTSKIARSANTPLELRGRSDSGNLSGVNDGDAMTVLASSR